MHFLKKHFENLGWNVVNWTYPSREKTIEEHAEDLKNFLRQIARVSPENPIHFITHSMGSLVLRAALNAQACPEEAKIGKAVLLVPPSQGSSLGRALGHFEVVQKVVKPFAGRQLVSEKNFEKIGEFPPSKQVLVIAGSCKTNPFIEEENDGILTVRETFLNTPHEHVVIPTEHLAILFSKKAFHLAERFLEK